MSDSTLGTAAPAAPAAATPSAPSDTGASSTPVSAGSSAPSTPVDRPRSMADALQRAAAPSASATPDASAAADPDAAPATAAPAGPPETPGAPLPTPEPAKGPIPFERHQAALENARKKAAESAQAQFVQRFAPQLQVVQQLTADPDTAIPQLYREWRESKGLSAEMDASDAARMLAARRGQAAPEAMPEPDLIGTDASGRQVPFYSADQLARRDAWLQQQMLSQVKQEFAPLQQEYAQTQAARAQQRQVEQLKGVVTPVLSAFREKPGFKEYETEISARQAELAETGMHPLAALGVAYADIVPARLQSRAQASTQSTLMQQAAAKVAGSVSNPGQVHPSPPRRPRSLAEALKQQATGA